MVMLWCRVLLGICEAGFLPGMLLYLTFWFAKEYRSRMLGWFFLGVPLATRWSGLRWGACWSGGPGVGIERVALAVPRRGPGHSVAGGGLPALAARRSGPGPLVVPGEKATLSARLEAERAP